MKKETFVLSAILFLAVLPLGLKAQTFEFTYQGSLNSTGSPANGNYDFEFALFEVGGLQVGSTLTRTSVPVTDGVFTVSLNFGNNYTGADRELEIRVRPTGGGVFTTLAPRQLLRATPISIVSVSAVSALNATTATNATQLGGVAANQYVLTGDARLSDARNPLPNSPNYINNTTTQQTSSNFNISGNGTAGGILSGGTVNAVTQFNLDGNRILTEMGSFTNLIAGRESGNSSMTGTFNSFFGYGSGNSNTTGAVNSFFGYDSGDSNTTGGSNSFFGPQSGALNETGNLNSFFGRGSGNSNISGVANTMIGANTDVGSGDLTNASAIGNRAFVSQSNSLVLGSISGVNNSGNNTNVGIGTSAPVRALHVARGSAGSIAPNANTSLVLERSGNNYIQMFSPDIDESGLLFGNSTLSIKAAIIGSPTDGLQFRSGGNTTRMTLDAAGNFGIGTGSPSDRLHVNGIIRVATLGESGATALCRNASNQISLCSSSRRFKSNIQEFTSGLDLIKRLRPVTFNWIADGTRDIGLVAEEVADAEPLLSTFNDLDEIEGVKYDRIGIVLVNAIKEQQTQLEAQQKEIGTLKETVKTLTAALCELNPQLAVCKQEQK